ncbi:protein P'1 [Hapavirus ngaingan]|uniref:Protein P'1 n=1 Tax=Hapavirus ngaingan TaxID=1972623 RepID=D3GGL0_9RHAB|nr:protein P'1 [Hapavirus ngaingan]ACX83601.1 protein P'1 [Hapavirus ngaingan]
MRRHLILNSISPSQTLMRKTKMNGEQTRPLLITRMTIASTPFIGPSQEDSLPQKSVKLHEGWLCSLTS